MDKHKSLQCADFMFEGSSNDARIMLNLSFRLL